MSNKDRTSITIEPDLFQEAKEYCVQEYEKEGDRVSFSELVSRALKEYIKPDEREEKETSTTNGFVVEEQTLYV